MVASPHCLTPPHAHRQVALRHLWVQLPKALSVPPNQALMVAWMKQVSQFFLIFSSLQSARLTEVLIRIWEQLKGA
jgi:hypothetical protein